jgi:hypothetical protein
MDLKKNFSFKICKYHKSKKKTSVGNQIIFIFKITKNKKKNLQIKSNMMTF